MKLGKAIEKFISTLKEKSKQVGRKERKRERAINTRVGRSSSKHLRNKFGILKKGEERSCTHTDNCVPLMDTKYLKLVFKKKEKKRRTLIKVAIENAVGRCTTSKLLLLLVHQEFLLLFRFATTSVQFHSP